MQSCGRAGDQTLTALLGQGLVALDCAEMGSQAMGRVGRDMRGVSALGTEAHSQRPCLSLQDINMG